jgi:sterol desaturase/sphingolipid hydroxylase (fatty acid hydroxylase superfamily)
MLELAAARFEELRGFFLAHHLGEVWAFFGQYPLNPQTYLVALLPALLLERLFPIHPRRRWLTPNFVFDYSMPIFDGVIWGPLTGLALVGIKELYDRRLPGWNMGLLDGQPAVVQAVGAFLVADLFGYLAHRLLHRVPWLWHFHAVHHSQRDLNPFTTKRAHLVEDLFSFAFALLPIGIVGGSYPTWFFVPVLNGYWSYFIHANVKTDLGPLRYLLVSPQNHRVHHSLERRHFDKNFGTQLAVWDYLFGTAWRRYDEYPASGVAGFPVPEETSRTPWGLARTWLALTVYPFRRIGGSIRARFARTSAVQGPARTETDRVG